MEAPKHAIVWVAGGRDYPNKERVFEVLDRYEQKHGVIRIVHGACCDKEGRLRGADLYAELWAIKNEVPYIGVPALWTKLGNSAGPVRNELIRDEYDVNVLIAFPGGDGTLNAIRVASRVDLPIFEIDRG